jgi:hypothetical protein
MNSTTYGAITQQQNRDYIKYILNTVEPRL